VCVCVWIERECVCMERVWRESVCMRVCVEREREREREREKEEIESS